MFDRLRRRKKTGVESWRAFIFLHDFRAFVGDADDGVAGLGLRLLVDGREDLFEPSDVAFGLSLVLGKRPFELGRLRRLLHLGEGGEDFLLREIDVLQRVVEQLIEFLWLLSLPLQLSPFAESRTPGRPNVSETKAERKRSLPHF